MKEYIGASYKVIIDCENITIIKNNITKEVCTFNDIIAITLVGTSGTWMGALDLTTKKIKYPMKFSRKSYENLVELCDVIADKSKIQIQRESGTVNTLKALFWVLFPIIMILSILQSRFGIFG